MTEVAVLISAALAFVAILSLVVGVRAQLRLSALKKKQDTDNLKIKDLVERMDSLKTNFMKVLRPIRQNAESIDELDDDLGLLQKRIDEMAKELKKRQEENPPTAVV